MNTTISIETVYGSVRTFIYANYLYARPEYDLGPDDSMLGHGVIDSMGVLELVDFLRDAFNVDVLDEHITEENFGTLNALTRYVVSRNSSAAEITAA